MTNTTNATTTTTLTRANRLTVKPNGEGFTADLFRTHKHLLTIESADHGTAWQAHDPAAKDTTKLQLREDYRAWIVSNAATFGIDYDPIDRRTDDNKRIASYLTDNDLVNDAIAMVSADIEDYLGNLTDRAFIHSYLIACDGIEPMTTTSKGSDLSKMGVLDGKYVSTGKWAWANLALTVTIACYKPTATARDATATPADITEVYQPIAMALVSGQLKKPHMTQTMWNTEVRKSLIEAGVLVDAPKTEPTKPTAEETAAAAKQAAKDAKAAAKAAKAAAK